MLSRGRCSGVHTFINLFYTQGPFLKSPGKFTDPKLYFKIKI